MKRIHRRPGYSAYLAAATERIRDTREIRRQMDAENLAARISPWDTDADVERIALAAGLPSDAGIIIEARKVLRDNHVKNEHGLPGWGDGE